MRNFGSGLVYTLNDSTPVYARACSFNDFSHEMNRLGVQTAIPAGVMGALSASPTGPGAIAAGLTAAGYGYVAGASLGFINKAWECWF